MGDECKSDYYYEEYNVSDYYDVYEDETHSPNKPSAEKTCYMYGGKAVSSDQDSHAAPRDTNRDFLFQILKSLKTICYGKHNYDLQVCYLLQI